MCFCLSFLNDAFPQAMTHTRATDMHLAILLFRAGRIDQMIMLMSVELTKLLIWLGEDVGVSFCEVVIVRVTFLEN